MRTRGRAGYTLLELIVVMALIGIVFFFALPRFEGSFLLDDANTSSRWLIGKLQALREDALRSRRLQVLHVDLDTGRLWATAEGMTPEQQELARRRAQLPAGGGRVFAIEFAGQPRLGAGRAEIRFFGDGHTDRVLLHLRSGDAVASFLLEPFLAQVKRFDTMVGFDNARL
jgi:prepilin-type N-terminal cleavage/methylation domain-containing protein